MWKTHHIVFSNQNTDMNATEDFWTMKMSYLPIKTLISTVQHLTLAIFVSLHRGFPSGLAVKNPPARQDIWVWSLGQEDALEKGMATHSSILAWEIPWTEKPGKLQSMGLQWVRHNWVTEHACTHTQGLHTYTSRIYRHHRSTKYKL